MNRKIVCYLKNEIKEFTNSDDFIIFLWKKPIFHRTDGPSILQYEDGITPMAKEWYINGRRHRMDGPAIENCTPGFPRVISNYYYIDDLEMTKDQFDFEVAEAASLPEELRLTDPRWWVRNEI